MLYLALSCLQGREMLSAARELLGLGVNGIQLTPGNVPTPGFQEWLERQQVSTRTHHGFHLKALKRRVWSKEADCLVNADSVHPPQIKDGIAETWKQKAERGDYDRLLETMYPGYCLGCGEELSWAMDLGLKLAVDVSHIHIQLCQGVLDESVWHRLQAYDRIGELHVSANNGLADIHQALTKETFGLDWVRDRSSDGTPVILECYMHRLSDVQRREQIELVIG
jgi:hypothetical protein